MLARDVGVPCLAVAGLLEAGAAELERAGIAAAYSLTERAGSAAAAQAEAARWLREVTATAVGAWAHGG